MHGRGQNRQPDRELGGEIRQYLTLKHYDLITIIHTGSLVKLPE